MPQRVGRYRLEEVIGVGSFATVHRAVDERLDDTVVVKVLAENHSLNPEIRERFIAEGRALRRVDSPHVVTVHDLGESERQQPYLVLEHADRGTLAARVAELRRGGWVADPADVLVVAGQLAEAVEAIHGARLVHRDLSPANVLLTAATDVRRAGAGPSPTAGASLPGVAFSAASVVRPDERLLVADLGMCKDLALNSGLTVAGGTAGFRPPEMDGGPAVIDTRADLWSLSALMTWLCEGADLPKALTEALRRSLALDPEDRHPDVASWSADVEAALAPPSTEPSASDGPPPDQPSAAVRPSPADGPSRHGRSTHRRRLLSLVGLVTAALLLGLLGGWLLAGPGSPPEATRTARVEIQGPEEVTVGEPTSFSLRHVGVSSWVWVLPTGQHVADEESVTLIPTGPGTSTVVVRSRDADGKDLEHVHRFTVGE